MHAMVENTNSKFSEIKQITVDATDPNYRGVEKPLNVINKARCNIIPWLYKSDFVLVSASDSQLIIFSSTYLSKENHTNAELYVESLNDFKLHVAENQVSGRFL